MSDFSRFKTSIGKAKQRPEKGITESLSRAAPSTLLGQDRKSSSTVLLSRQERMHHTHIIGGTGTGKSKIMELMLRRDVIDRRAGTCLIDPHGSLYEEVVNFVSHRYPNQADRFILFNPAQELDHILGFNPIPSSVEHIDYLLDSLISGCLKAWGQDNTDDTPRISKWLENIFHTIIANDLTLVESAPLLNIHSKDQRQVLLQKVGSEMVLDDWRTFEASNVNQKQSLIEGAANRLRKFLRNEIIRNVIGQRQSSLDFSSVMDEGKVVLINLNGLDRISPDNAQLLGIMIVNEIFRCAKLRNPRDTKKKPFFFYIDEFANFVTRDIARSLEETRKFGLFLTLSHQHLMQLYTEDEYLYSSVMTNCQNKIVFGGLSHDDAQLMMKEVSTGFMELKQIKDELETTKVRHTLEKREVRNWGSSETIGHSLTKSVSNAIGRSRSHGGSQSETSSTSNGHGQTKHSGSGQTEKSSNYSDGHATSRTDNWSNSTSETKTTGEAKGESSSKGKSEGFSETYVSVPEEYHEISSRTFWSLQEIQHMETASIKNQGVAQAFVKVGRNEPKKINVTRLREIPFNPRTSQKRNDQFKDKVFLAHPNYYKKAADVQIEYDRRQTHVFGRPLQFEATLITQEEKKRDGRARSKEKY